MLTGNKGEWSELYALFKIIADKNIYAGDGDLNKIEEMMFPVISVLRNEINNSIQFSYDNDIVIVKGNNEFRIPVSEFEDKAQQLLDTIINEENGTFAVEEAENFINSYESHSIKAKSTVKSDIVIVIHDKRTGTKPELGFSIKSQLGNPSTLLNAGETTNFKYEIINPNLSDSMIEEINNINCRNKIKTRLKNVLENSDSIKFINTQNNVFGNNLTLIDSSLKLIISRIVFLFFSTNKSNLTDLTNMITQENPLHFDLQNEHPFYEYKIKRLLSDIALGMMPGTVWKGQLDATGGYIIVKEDGDVLCYHIYNRNEFEDYLFKNTKLDTASSSRHKFGTIYKDNGKLYFNLNLQIRFLK